MSDRLDKVVEEIICDVMVGTVGTDSHRPMSVIRTQVKDRIEEWAASKPPATPQPSEPPKPITRSQCDCPCHNEGTTIMHFAPCCVPDPKPEAQSERDRALDEALSIVGQHCEEHTNGKYHNPAMAAELAGIYIAIRTLKLSSAPTDAALKGGNDNA